MAYDEDLTNRFRHALNGLDDVEEKRMMGGVCFMVNGNMLGGAHREKDGHRRFMFRVGKDNQAEALRRPGAKAMEMGGRRMGGFIFVDAEACDDKALKSWIDFALIFVAALPAK
ncbi:MAG: TfoX/Sxy family protein [Geminicoccaceae bacterium]